MNPNEFVNLLYGGAEDGWITLNFFPNKLTTWFRINDELPPFNINQNCYLGIGVRKERKEPETRGTSEDVIAIPGLWLDLDFESEQAHKAKGNLPPDVNACLQLVSECPLEPSLVIHSGHGLQAYWLFNETWYFDNEEEKKLASSLVGGWQSWFKDHAKKRGWHVDSTQDLARVFRIPGTYNCKTTPILVEVLSESAIRYEPSDFEDYAITHDEQPADRPEKDKHSEDFRLDPSIYDTTKYLIIHGDTLGKYPSRSEAVYSVVSGLIRCGYSDDAIIPILTNPSNGISPLPIEKGVKWILNEIKRARKKSSQKDGPAEKDSSVKKDGPAYFLTEKGKVRETQANYEIMMSKEPDWIGRLSYDEFFQTVEVDGHPITDLDRYLISSWGSHQLEMTGTSTKARDSAIAVVASHHSHDALKDFLNTLPVWDKTQRVERLFQDLCGAKDNPLNRWCGQMLLAQMMARALVPGCVARYVIVLEGPQDIGKSRFVRELSCGWYTSLGTDLDSKESSMILKGVWLAELDEMGAITRSRLERVKSFISEQHDHFIPKYANDPVHAPRRCVLIATTNRDNYLIDDTGDTRWFPVLVTKADVAKLAKQRDQLLAEGLDWYRRHESDWWVIPPDVMGMLKPIREDRQQVNVYEERIAQWLYENAKEETHWTEIASECLELDYSQWRDKSLQMQVMSALSRLGWTKGKRRRLKDEKKKQLGTGQFATPWIAPKVEEESAVHTVHTVHTSKSDEGNEIVI